ncbi:MAG TPA: hypothetical protein VEK08_25235 [Planctomycetota bacterium]|nr:hypothetical protein [Planctomycetota bacterium]
MKKTLLIFSLALLLQLSCFAGQPKKETLEEAEEKAAALEDEAEKLLPEKEQFLKQFHGKINIVSAVPGEPLPKVVGTFLTETGQLFQLKLANAFLHKDLLEQNNRKVLLSGKVRNDGKYFIVHHIVEQLVAPVERRRRGGI